MPAKRSSIVIDITAGTAKLVQDLNGAGAKVKDFEQKLHAAGSHGVTAMSATSGSIRLLEGNFTNNIRAVERFIATTLQLGPIIQAAFPLVGAGAFLGLVFSIGKEMTEFIKEIQEAPAKIEGSFRALIAPLRLSNDELRVATDLLNKDIARLTGHQQNSLQLTLDEARVSADKLADSLERGLAELYKFNKENQVSVFRRIVLGETGTKDLTEMVGGSTGYTEDVEAIAKINREKIRKVNEAADKGDLEGQKAAQLDSDRQLKSYFDGRIGYVKTKMEEASKAAQPKTEIFNSGTEGPQEVQVAGDDVAARTALLQKDLDFYQKLRSEIGLTVAAEDARHKKNEEDAARENRLLEKAPKDKLAELRALAAGIQSRINVIGAPEDERTKAAGEAQALKHIAEVNKRWEEKGRVVDAATRKEFEEEAQKISALEAEEMYKNRLDVTTKAITERIRSLGLLTAAIGEGYEATKKANVEALVMAQMKEKYDSTKKEDLDTKLLLQRKFGAQLEAEHAEQIGNTIDKLEDQIVLEGKLAEVQIRGAEAIRQVTNAQKFAETVKSTGSPKQAQAELDAANARQHTATEAAISQIKHEIEATQRLTAAQVNGAFAVRQAQLENDIIAARRGTDNPDEVEAQMRKRFAADQAMIAASNLRGITVEIDATKRLTAAVTQGAEAQRKAGLESKYAAMEDENRGSSVGARKADALSYDLQIRQQVMATTLQYRDQAESIRKQLAILDEMKFTSGSILEISLERKRLEDELLHIQVQEALQRGRLQDGWRAFFLDMQTQAAKPGEVLYRGLHDALDGFNDSLARTLSGQKGGWGQMMQQVGFQLEKDSMKALEQKGLGALGKWLGIKPTGAPTLRAGDPGHVIVDNLPGAPGTPSMDTVMKQIPGAKGPSALGGILGGLVGGLGGLFGGGDLGGGIFSLFKKGGGGFDGGVSYGGARASGGPVSPGQAYLLGEHGPEIAVFGSSGRVMSNAASRRMMGDGGSNHYYSIDARGTDPVQTEQRVRTAILAAHRDAISTSVQVNVERMSRVPAGR